LTFTSFVLRESAAETRKPVENVFWEDGKAPAGKYQVYVHYYKKHNKRRSKDPTKFQVIVNAGNDLLEYNSELSSGDPIMMVAEFTLPTPEEREARRKELEEELRLAEQGTSGQNETEDLHSDEVDTEQEDVLPGAPDLDALMDEQADED